MGTIEFREPVESDLGQLILLNQRYKDKYLADGETLPDDIQVLYREFFNLEVLAEKFALVFTVTHVDGSEQVIGSADFTDINHDLSAVLHFIIEPSYIRQFLTQKTYLDALLDRFRVLRVRKLLVVSEFFCTSAHKLARAIGFKHTATLTDIVRQRQKIGDTYQFVVGDLHYFELTKKDLAKALAAHFIAEEAQEQEPDHVEQQEQSQKRSGAKKPVKPVRDADQQRKKRKLQPDLPDGAKRHPQRRTRKRGGFSEWSAADGDKPIPEPDGQLPGEPQPLNG